MCFRVGQVNRVTAPIYIGEESPSSSGKMLGNTQEG